MYPYLDPGFSLMMYEERIREALADDGEGVVIRQRRLDARESLRKVGALLSGALTSARLTPARWRSA